MKRYISLIMAIVIIAITLVGCTENGTVTNPGGSGDKIAYKRVDDWEYDGVPEEDGFRNFFSGLTNSMQGGVKMEAAMDSASMNMAPSAAGSNLGFSVGGAKDINNFRENIENGYFPISTDITYNGLFYDYFFEVGAPKTITEDLFAPAYSVAVSKDPISKQNEYYMTVGLTSNIKESDFQRKKLNLVLVLDISGSMSSSLRDYYYDDPFGLKDDKEDESKSKMQAANESINILLDQLNDDDRFGVVLFDDSSYVGKEISMVAETDMEAIKGHILEIGAQGGTNFEAGYTTATKLFDEYKNVDSDEYENRVIVITDAMPNYGELSKDGLMGMVADNADDGIYTTFIGVGVDFNTNLIETISDVKGANYYSVNTVKEFEKRMGEQFEYMVTPLVFDLELSLESEDYEIAGVYGSDTVNKENGSIMNVNTLFPSKSEGGEVKGGVVLLKLKKLNDNEEGTVKLNVSYKDRKGETHANSEEVVIRAMQEETYENTGIRKAIALTRYVNTIKNWILYERTEENKFLIVPVHGIVDCEYTRDEIEIMLGEYERPSVDLSVSSEYKEIFKDLKVYLENEIAAIGDDTMNQEIDVLDKLIERQYK